MRTNDRKGLCSARQLFVLLTLLSLLSLTGVRTQGQSGLRPHWLNSCLMDGDQSLARGLFLFRTDAVGPDVENMLIRNRSSQNPTDAETATFYLARYYQRTYYLLYDKTGVHTNALMDKSLKVYSEYLTRFDNGNLHPWASDARFYRCLAYLQQQKTDEARKTIQEMNTRRDNSIYIYQILWSASPADVIDTTYNATEMRAFLLNYFRQSPKANFAQLVRDLKAECFRRKSPQQQNQQTQQQKLFPKY